jgi:Cu/Ag efflux pump CusA
VDDIHQLLIDTPGGGHVRLGEVADVRIVSSPTVIRREGISPYLDIVFNVQGRDATAVMSDVKTGIQNFAFPIEYHAEVLVDYKAQQQLSSACSSHCCRSG